MRLANTLFAALLATTQLAAQAAAMPSTCTKPADRTAFDTVGLKSELMVTALTCKQQDKYNQFMTVYKPAVSAGEKDLNTYFKRVYGRQYQKAYDDYITNLADVQSQESLKSGTAFCTEFLSMFDEVMALHDSTELPDFAHSQAIVQPVDFTTCADETMPAKKLRGHHRVSHKKAA